MHQQRIEKYDEDINAVVIRDFDRAGKTANAIDNGKPDSEPGALLGLPMTIKESINVRGWRTCCGIVDARGFVSEHDAPTTVRRQYCYRADGFLCRRDFK